MNPIDGNAIVYCEGAFNTTNGKTAHGLVRFTRRYRVVSVVDSHLKGHDAGEVLDGKANGIPIFASIEEAVSQAEKVERRASHLVIGLAPDGGRLGGKARRDIEKAVGSGLNIDCGLHDFLTDDAELMELAKIKGITIRDIRKPKPPNELHFFEGKIEDVTSLKIAVLGTDSAVGKRTTAWLLVQALEKLGCSAMMIGTGQTAWMQGVDYGIIMDSIINDFVSGEIENVIWKAWKDRKPDVIVVEGQGSLLNPAYPGGFEILAAGRPDAVILQHAPEREFYDGFPGYLLHPLPHQIQAIETISGKPVIAITLNHENIDDGEIASVCNCIGRTVGLPVFDVLVEGAEKLAGMLVTMFPVEEKKPGTVAETSGTINQKITKIPLGE